MMTYILFSIQIVLSFVAEEFAIFRNPVRCDNSMQIFLIAINSLWPGAPFTNID